MIITARHRLVVSALMFLLVLGAATAGAQPTSPGAMDGAPTVERVAGPDRASTAAALAERAAPDVVEVAYLASAANFPDALVGGPAATRQQGVLLLTDTDSLPASTQPTLLRLEPRRIVVLGGPAAISQAVQAQLVSLTSGTVTRLSGDSRFATAAAVSQTATTKGGTVILASGEAFPDALAGGPLAVSGRRTTPVGRPGLDPGGHRGGVGAA